MANICLGAEPMTPLDRALVEAQKDESKAKDYYDLFLRSDIYVPTFNVPEIESEGRTKEGDSFTPVIIDHDGKRFLILFDTFERLQGYATRDIGFVQLPGHVLLESIPDGMHWTLNHTTEFFKEFLPEEIEELRRNLAGLGPKEITIQKETQVLIGAPAKIPDGLIPALTEICRRNHEITQAFLGQVFIVGVDKAPHLSLVVTTSGVSNPAKEAIMRDLAVAARNKMGEANFMDISVDGDTSVVQSIVQDVKPFYKK